MRARLGDGPRPWLEASLAAFGARTGDEEGPHVRLAGRLVAWRGHGKTAFAHVADVLSD